MQTQITANQESLRALSNSLTYAGEMLRQSETKNGYLESELELAHKYLAYMGHELYKAWKELPDGSPLKDLYRDEVWSPEAE